MSDEGASQHAELGATKLGVTIRRAVEADLPEVVRMFAIQEEGNRKNESSESPLPRVYADALAAIANDPNNMLLVAVLADRVVGAFHFTVIQYIANRGGRTALIENVIVDPPFRGRGVGEAMMRWAIDEARRRACFRVQLTSNKVRKRAHAFYTRLGFVASHEGFKLPLV
jgi:GNAT superfamily N-acetyltransferase